MALVLQKEFKYTADWRVTMLFEAMVQDVLVRATSVFQRITKMWQPREVVVHTDLVSQFHHSTIVPGQPGRVDSRGRCNKDLTFDNSNHIVQV